LTSLASADSAHASRKKQEPKVGSIFKLNRFEYSLVLLKFAQNIFCYIDSICNLAIMLQLFVALLVLNTTYHTGSLAVHFMKPKT
jgi:hypothetical protein